MVTKVYKVGGDSTGVYENIQALGEFARSEATSVQKLVFVVSAQASENFRTTEALRKQFRGENNLDGIIKQHKGLVERCGIYFNQAQLKKFVLEAETLEEMESVGERINAPFVAGYFNSVGIPTQYKSALDLLQTKNGEVELVGNIPEGVTIIEGFIYSSKGKIKTFPTGGSEVSGDIIAAGLNADIYGVIKNNPWFCTADPKIVNGALQVEYLTFRELAELAYAGARAMNEQGMIRCARNNIPILIGSATDFMEHATSVKWERTNLTERPYAGIASKGGFIVYDLKPSERFDYLRNIFSTFAEEGVSVDMVTTNGDVSIAVHNSEPITERLELKLQALSKGFSKKENISLVSVVGENMPPASGFGERLVELIYSSGFERPHVYGAMALPKEMSVLEIEQLGMNSIKGYLAKILLKFSEFRIPVTGILTTVGSIGIQCPANYHVAQILRDIKTQFKPDLISVIETNRGIPASPKRTTNVTLAVPEQECNQVVRILHRNLF